MKLTCFLALVEPALRARTTALRDQNMRALLQQIVDIRLVELLDDLSIVLEQHGVGSLTEKLFHLLGVHLHILGVVLVHLSLKC